MRFADQFGDRPSPDWCTVIDASSNDELVAAMVLVRQHHVTFPPTLPEFAALVKEARRPRRSSTPLRTEQLTEFVVTHYALTPDQLCGWTFLYRQAEDGTPITSGVVIPADGEAPGYRVTVEDMQAAGVEL